MNDATYTVLVEHLKRGYQQSRLRSPNAIETGSIDEGYDYCLQFLCDALAQEHPDFDSNAFQNAIKGTKY